MSLELSANSLSLFTDGVCFDPETKKTYPHHSICVGKKCAYCMDCGKIIIEFNHVNDFKKLMNPFDPYGDE